MYFLWRRWSRAGYLPPWFYALIGAGFAALAAFGVARGEWLVVALAMVMIPVTAAAALYMPRLARAANESQQHYYPPETTRGDQ